MTEIDGLRDQIVSELLTSAGTRVGTVVLFSQLPVDGWFKHETVLQILPAPNGAPRPKWLLADHPFMLQFSFPSSSSSVVRNSRKANRGRELALMLSALRHRPGRAAAHDESKTSETRRLNGATAPHAHPRDQVRAASPIVAAIQGDHRDEPLPSIPDHAILQWTNLYSHAIADLRNLGNHRHDWTTQAWAYCQLEDERLELAQVVGSHPPRMPSSDYSPDVRFDTQTHGLQ